MTARRGRRAGVEDRWRRKDGTPTSTAGQGRRWRARYVDDRGREHAHSFDRKSDAQNWLSGQAAAVQTGTHIAPRDASVTFAEWSERWIAGYGVNRASTVRQARSHLNRLNAEFGDVELRDIQPSGIRAWLATMSNDEGLKPGTVAAYHARLRHILDDAVHDRYLARNPCSRRTSPAGARQRVFCPTTEQMWQLHDLIKPHLRVAVLLGAFSGLRVAEACGLRTADVDFARGVAHPKVQRGADGVVELKTKGSAAPIPIPRELTLMLSASVQQWPGETLVTDGFGSSVGPWVIQRAFSDVRGHVTGAPADFHFHDLRHYLASMLIASGADVKVVQARLRHSSATTTLNTYAHLWPDADESTKSAITSVLAERVQRPEARRPS